MTNDPVALSPPAARGFLPDLCTPAATLPLVIIAALVAVALAVARAGAAAPFWQDLGRLALFCEILTLASAAVVCVLRRFLAGRATGVVVAVVFVALVATALGVAEGAYVLLAALGIPVAGGARAHWLWLLRIVVVAAVVDALVLRYLYVSAEWRENVRREAASRLAALTARIRPHFLFNTLNTAAALVAERPADAERTLENLADLFRASLAERGERVTLAEDLETVRRYLAIEALRLGPRLTVDWRIEPAAGRASLPPFVLQPLVENAITHGIEPRGDGGTVAIAAACEAGRLEITITNPLAPDDPGAGHGVGLAGVRARLALAFGAAAGLEAGVAEGRYRVRLFCPLQEAEGANPARR